jgi:hypothetical protein
MENDFTKLNRFTTIPFLIDLLKRKKLSLLNPGFWEDFNDRETIEIYRKAIGARSIYALCLTYKDETIHHWNAFASGSGGCCIEFRADELIDVLKKNKIKHDKAQYIRVRDLVNLEFEKEKLPYVKREPFQPENEYRLIITSNDEQMPSYDIEIDLDIIRKITITNKVPPGVYQSLVETLTEIAPEFRGKFHQSTLYNNEKWIDYFKKTKYTS